MKKNCPKFNGLGSIVVDYKECSSCGGTGYEDDAFDVGSHLKGVNNNARAKFDLGSDQDIPCEACNGKGQVEVMKIVLTVTEQATLMFAVTAASL